MKKINSLLFVIVVSLFSSTLIAVEKGGAIPACTLSELGGGGNSTLANYQGNVLYVDFWASWCGPCVKSFPFLNDLHRQFKDRGLHVIAINLDENLADAKDFLAKYPADFTVVADVGKQCAKDFDVKAMPSSYIIDRKGLVHHIQLGFKPGEAQILQRMVEKLLNEMKPG